MGKGWIAYVVIGQDDWDILAPVGVEATEEEAVKLANSKLEPVLVIEDGQATIRMTVDGQYRYVSDEDVVIKQIHPEKWASMGRPLDMSNPEDKATAVKALLTNNPAYVVEESDMIKSTLTLANFIERYGQGYKLDNIGYQVTQAS